MSLVNNFSQLCRFKAFGCKVEHNNVSEWFQLLVRRLTDVNPIFLQGFDPMSLQNSEQAVE